MRLVWLFALSWLTNVRSKNQRGLPFPELVAANLSSGSTRSLTLGRKAEEALRGTSGAQITRCG
jgi:hypothetical protein